MGELFEISFERFLDEVRIAKLTPNGFNKIEMEELNNFYAFYLTPVGINKTYVTVIEKENFTDVQKFALGPFTRSARRVTQSSDLRDISIILARIEEELKRVPIIK